MVTTADKKSWGETWREVGTSLWEARGWSKINGIVRVIILTIVSASSLSLVIGIGEACLGKDLEIDVS